MYEVSSDGNVLGTFNPVFIRLSDNGSYVPCDESVAEGICVKLPKEVENEVTDEETGAVTTETRTVYEDTVFRLIDGGLTGEEPLCSITKTEGEE